MTNALEQSTPSTLTVIGRYLLIGLSLLFLVGSVVQFFLAGLAVFDTPLRWTDHENLGHALGLIPYLLWIPAVIGRVGRKLILGSVALIVLFLAQYAFVNIEEPAVQALHPVNGVVMLLLSLWIARGTFELLRRPRSNDPGARVLAPEGQEART